MAANLKLKDSLFDSFWFMPLTLGVLGILLGQIMIYADHHLQGSGVFIPLSEMGAEGGRSILTAIAGSMLGVAATSFSITTAVLATASTTYGPRLVRNFMSDKRNQFVLGSFAASFLYALTILRSVRDTGDVGTVFVPSLSINIAILFGILNVILLIYFIHHIADSVQISTLISRVRDDLIRSVESLYPLKNDHESSDTAGHAQFEDVIPLAKPNRILSMTDGYITWIDYEAMAETAREKDQYIKILVQPGDYVFMGRALADVWQDGHEVDDGGEWLLANIHTAQTRTPYQDIRYSTQHPVDITIRALSPSMNDPYTAINALGGLNSGLTRLCQRENEPSTVVDKNGKVRLHKQTITIEHVLDSIFRTLRSNVVESVDATMATLELAQNILQTTTRDSYINIVLKSIKSIEETFMASDSPETDKVIIKNMATQIINKNSVASHTDHSPLRAKSFTQKKRRSW